MHIYSYLSKWMIFCMLKFLSYSQVRQTDAVQTVSVLSSESTQSMVLLQLKIAHKYLEGFSTLVQWLLWLLLRYYLFRGAVCFKSLSNHRRMCAYAQVFLYKWICLRCYVKAFIIFPLLNSHQTSVPSCCSADVLLSFQLQQVATPLVFFISWEHFEFLGSLFGFLS